VSDTKKLADASFGQSSQAWLFSWQFPDFYLNPLHFTDSCKISWRFRVFRTSGHPVLKGLTVTDNIHVPRQFAVSVGHSSSVSVGDFQSTETETRGRCPLFAMDGRPSEADPQMTSRT